MSPARTATRSDELSIRAWAAELEAAAQIARQLAPTAFLPPSHRRFHRDDQGRFLDGKDGRAYRLDIDATTATAAAAIMTGQELGLPPGAALRSIAVINDTPALSALALRAILQTQGHDIWVLPESNSTRAIVRARRAGSDEIQTSTWTIERAKTLGLYPGTEKSNWRRQPTAMLIARATAEAARWVAADAILGIPLIAEELMDELEGTGEPLAIEAGPAANGEQPKERKTARRKAAARAPALPTGPLPGPAEPPPAESQPAAPKLPKAMLDKIHAGLRDVGVGEDRDKALTLISGWAGTRIDSTTKLTPDQAHAVLDGLDVLRQTARRHEAETAQADAEAPQEPPPGDEPP
jgi:hypothetical protein